MAFDPAAHPLLSPEAAAMGTSPLAAQARLAEDLLSVLSDDYDALPAGSTLQRAWQEMVVLQINYQVARGVAGEAFTRQGLGDLQQTYRAADAVSLAARALRDRFFGRGETDVGGCDIDGGSFHLDAVTE